jgi:DNA-binding response OmpR family regulator
MILCVEDDEASRAVLAVALKQFSPAFAATAREAVVLFNSAVFEAYVLDVWLPDYNGISLCRDIRRSDPHVPIVLWTVADRDDMRNRAQRAGASAYLEKTPEYEALQDTLGQLLRTAAYRYDAAATEAARALSEVAAKYQQTESDQRASQAIERFGKDRARKMFIQAGGTLCQFERWWAHKDLAKISGRRPYPPAPATSRPQSSAGTGMPSV